MLGHRHAIMIWNELTADSSPQGEDGLIQNATKLGIFVMSLGGPETVYYVPPANSELSDYVKQLDHRRKQAEESQKLAASILRKWADAIENTQPTDEKCSHCNAPWIDNAVFCTRCGMEQEIPGEKNVICSCGCTMHPTFHSRAVCDHCGNIKGSE